MREQELERGEEYEKDEGGEWQQQNEKVKTSKKKPTDETKGNQKRLTERRKRTRRLRTRRQPNKSTVTKRNENYLNLVKVQRCMQAGGQPGSHRNHQGQAKKQGSNEPRCVRAYTMLDRPRRLKPGSKQGRSCLQDTSLAFQIEARETTRVCASMMLFLLHGLKQEIRAARKWFHSFKKH